MALWERKGDVLVYDVVRLGMGSWELGVGEAGEAGEAEEAGEAGEAIGLMSIARAERLL